MHESKVAMVAITEGAKLGREECCSVICPRNELQSRLSKPWPYSNDRSSIDMSRPTEVVRDAENDHTCKHQTAVIHRRSCWMVHRRPQAKEKNDDDVDNSKAVRHYTENTRNTPRAPREFLTRYVGERVRCAGVELDVAA